MKSDRHPLSYDNRGAEPHRPWPKAHRVPQRRFKKILGRVLIVLAVAAALSYLYEGKASCEATLGGASRHCVD